MLRMWPLWCNKYWHLLNGHRCVSLGYLSLLSTISEKHVRITKQSNSDKSVMRLDQRKQQQWQLYIASMAATTLVVLLERGNTAPGMHFKLQMIPLSQHWLLLAQISSSVTAHLQQLTSHLRGLWPESHITKMDKLRWWMFRKKADIIRETSTLPPTAAIITASNCVQLSPDQCRTKTCPEIPSAEDWLENRWRWMDTRHDYRTTCTTSLVKCGCKTQYHSERCSCRQAGLNYTELCGCIDEKQPRENALASQTYKWNYVWMHSQRKSWLRHMFKVCCA